MGMPAILKQTGVGRSTLWMPDFFQDPFNIGIGCVISGGTPTYNIEHTFDDPNALVSTFNGQITTTVLTINNMYSGSGLVAVGQVVLGLGSVSITPNTSISSLGSGSGNAGTYNLNNSQSAGPGPMATINQTWFQNSGITGASANANGNYQFPVRAISINITGGSGTVTATFVQATFAR
jgi:hypothetical protein